jgi:hypothetical protein
MKLTTPLDKPVAGRLKSMLRFKLATSPQSETSGFLVPVARPPLSGKLREVWWQGRWPTPRSAAFRRPRAGDQGAWITGGIA